MKNLHRFAGLISAAVISGLMTGCADISSSDSVETKTTIDVPKSTTTVTLSQAEPTATCRAERYDMDLKLDTERKQLSGKVTIKLINETEDTLQELCIRSDASHDMQIQNVIIEETKQKLEVREKQEAGVFYADIASMPLQPGQSISLELDFVTEIPNQKNRFGYTVNGEDEIYQLTFCFPRIAMYENGTWDENPYINDGGENNYVTVSDYDVTLEVPEKFTVIASGDEETTGNTTTITGKNLRQLAIFAATNMKMDTEIVQDVSINNYYFAHEGNEEYNAMTKDAAKDSFSLYTALFGEYPYQELDIVQGYYSSAMEYSGIILMGLPDQKDVTELDKNASFISLCSQVAHEAAHQWFYVYDGGTYFLCELRKAMGDGVFYPMLQEYYKAYHFNEVSTKEFVEVIRTFDNSESVRRIVEKYIQ